MTDNPTPTQEAVDEAAEATPDYFHGIKLQPYSSKRELCWLRCRDYGSEYESAVFMVFIRTLGDEIVEGTLTGKDIINLSRDNKQAFRDRCEAWADEHGITSQNDDGKEVMRIANKTWTETEASRFRIVPSKGSTGPNG